jgi:AcrR family transcriptional regulator
MQGVCVKMGAMGSLEVEQEVRRRTGGRSARVREAVLHATLDALSEHEPGAVTISEIARRAGVHATSIQRRWGSKENVLLEALLTLSQQKVPIPDTGALRGDLAAFGRSMAGYLASAAGGTVARTLAASEDDAFLAANRERLVWARYEAARVMIDRAAERGELRPGTNPQVALELLVGPLHYRALITRHPVDSGYIEELVDTLLRGLAE